MIRLLFSVIALFTVDCAGLTSPSNVTSNALLFTSSMQSQASLPAVILPVAAEPITLPIGSTPVVPPPMAVEPIDFPIRLPMVVEPIIIPNPLAGDACGVNAPLCGVVVVLPTLPPWPAPLPVTDPSAPCLNPGCAFPVDGRP